MTRMHADEVATDAALVQRLVAAQFSEWGALRVERVAAFGTDNALYRLGDDLVARLPIRERAGGTLEKERRWLPLLAPQLPLAVPVPVVSGEPGEGYPFTWSVYRWLPGVAASEAPLADPGRAAAQLARFIEALQQIDPDGGPPPGEHNFFRGEPIAARNEATREAIAELGATVDAGAVTAAWEAAAGAPGWTGRPVWIHGDLDARNLLVEDGRLTAVVDFGGLGVGDPACDAMVAWKLFAAEAREHFRAALAVDDATWARARGWALSQAVIALAYYTDETNPGLVREARRWLAETLADA